VVVTAGVFLIIGAGLALQNWLRNRGHQTKSHRGRTFRLTG
jgi:hypothetical protein